MKGKRKLAVNMEGRILWGSKRNVKTEQNKYAIKSDESDWYDLKKLALEEVRRRKSEEWVLRNL